MTLEQFRDPRTGALYQPKKNGKGDRHVDSMFLTTNTAYQSNNKPLFKDTLKYFMSNDGDFYRYHYNEQSGRINNDPRHLSRDNFIGMLICLGKFNRQDLLKKEAIKILKRFSFYQNTRTYLDFKIKIPDFCGPVSWAVILKGLGHKNLLLDSCTLGMSLFAILKSKLAPDHASTVYHEVSTLHYLQNNSFLTKLAFNLYIKFRQPVKGFDAENGVISALKYYSRAGYDPNIYDITKKLLGF